MISIKHMFDPIEKTDGHRIWVEPIGVTLDLCEWCRIDQVHCHLGPPRELWDWFAKHPNGYEFFRGRYHEHLDKSKHRDGLIELVKASRTDNFTLLHQGENPKENVATALYEYLSALEAYCPREDK
jgi:uncharacterized protein YeaO (DUF488 family)